MGTGTITKPVVHPAGLAKDAKQLWEMTMDSDSGFEDAVMLMGFLSMLIDCATARIWLKIMLNLMFSASFSHFDAELQR